MKILTRSERIRKGDVIVFRNAETPVIADGLSGRTVRDLRHHARRVIRLSDVEKKLETLLKGGGSSHKP